MKTRYFVPIILVMTSCLYSCNHNSRDDEFEETPIIIESPTPTVQISKVSLSESQIPYVAAGNEFALRCLKTIYNDKNIVFSPLSLQYALALTSNGANGESADEITNAMGFDGNQEALNSYLNLLLNQLPAVDTDVELKLADAVIINDRFRAQNSFRQTAEEYYYSPVEYASSTEPEKVIARINEWASRNTHGLINPFLENGDINNSFIAIILNALYFNAKWSNSLSSPAFTAESEAGPFYLDGGGSKNVKYMATKGYFQHGEIGSGHILELPYANGKYSMYIILPEVKGDSGIADLLPKINEKSLSSSLSSMTTDAVVLVQMPMFETSSRLDLNKSLNDLGISKIFSTEAEFDRLIENDNDVAFYINCVLQKARIKVNEWGTEAAAVTAEILDGDNGEPDEEIEEISFIADHPFVYIIAEKTSGVILFEGIFNGLE